MDFQLFSIHSLLAFVVLLAPNDAFMTMLMLSSVMVMNLLSSEGAVSSRRIFLFVSFLIPNLGTEFIYFPYHCHSDYVSEIM